jgi:hypothetical protein
MTGLLLAQIEVDKLPAGIACCIHIAEFARRDCPRGIEYWLGLSGNGD